jgi:hypothetical protein
MYVEMNFARWEALTVLLREVLNRPERSCDT